MSPLTKEHLALLRGLVLQSNLEPAIRRELDSVLLQVLKPDLHLRYDGGAHQTNGGRWAYAGAGRWVLHLLANNPNRWVGLAPTKSHSGWVSAISRAVESLRAVDSDLARALDTTNKPNAPGTHLRTVDGCVQAMWRPGPGLVVGVGVKVA